MQFVRKMTKNRASILPLTVLAAEISIQAVSAELTRYVATGAFMSIPSRECLSSWPGHDARAAHDPALLTCGSLQVL